MCDECNTCPDRTGRFGVEKQSNPLFVLSVMKTHIPLTDRERIEKLSQQERLSKFCTDAGFLTTVEVGQYFITKDTEQFSQLTDSVACREYTLPRDESLSEPKGLDSREHQNWARIGSPLHIYLQGKYGVEIRIESVNQDNSHSWVRISHGLNKLVTDLIDKEYDDNEQETSETKTELFALKTEVFAFASRSKAKAKSRRPSTTCSSSRTVPIRERTWIDIEPGAQFDQARRITSRRRWCDRMLETER